MTEPDSGIRRVLQLKVRAMGDVTHVLAMIRSAAPFYQSLGNGGFRVLQNVDDPAQLLVEIEYQANTEIELNRHKVASDPMMRAFLQGWRAMLAGSADVDVYADVTQ